MAWQAVSKKRKNFSIEESKNVKDNTNKNETVKSYK